MAKGKRPVVSTVSAETKEFIEQCGKEIIAKLGDQFFEVDGTPTATVKYADGQFKKKPLIAGWNFKLEYCYVGQRGKLIFGLSPEDSQEYEFIEMDPKELDYTFPLVGPAVAPLFNLEGEKLTEILEAVIAQKTSDEVKAKEIEKIEAEKAVLSYEENEEFGIF
ncbi:hypothetical protein [Agrobacterium sp. CG674]